MQEENITKAVLTTDGRVLVKQPDGSYRPAEDRTDWERVRAMSDDEIEAAAADDPHAILSDDDWAHLKVVDPPGKRLLSIRLDTDVLSWFRQQGRGYQTRINAVLRAYVERRRQQGTQQ